jgi:hypothetical protein
MARSKFVRFVSMTILFSLEHVLLHGHVMLTPDRGEFTFWMTGNVSKLYGAPVICDIVLISICPELYCEHPGELLYLLQNGEFVYPAEDDVYLLLEDVFPQDIFYYIVYYYILIFFIVFFIDIISYIFFIVYNKCS